MSETKLSDHAKPTPGTSPEKANQPASPRLNLLTEILAKLSSHDFAMGEALRENRLRSGARKAKEDPRLLEKCVALLKEPPLEEQLGLIEKPALEEYLGIVKERTPKECSALKEEAVGLLECFHKGEISLRELRRYNNPALAMLCEKLCAEHEDKFQIIAPTPWDYAMQQIQERTVSLNAKVLNTYLYYVATADSAIVNEEKLSDKAQRVADTVEILNQDAALVQQLLRGIWKEFQADAESMELLDPDKIESNQIGTCPANRIVPKGRDDFIGIAAWLWCCHNHDPQFYAGALNPGVVYGYTEFLARKSSWPLNELFPLFWHCYRASQSNVRQYITCDLHDVDPEYVGRAADWLTQHLDLDSFDEEGRKLFKWLLDLHPDLSKKLDAVIDREDGAPSTEMTPTTKSTKVTAIASTDVDLDSKACAYLVAHPEWTMTMLKDRLGCSRQHLYNLPKLGKLRELLKSGKFNLPAGSKPKDGSLEAWKRDTETRTCPACRDEHKFVCSVCDEDDLHCRECHHPLKHPA